MGRKKRRYKETVEINVVQNGSFVSGGGRGT